MIEKEKTKNWEILSKREEREYRKVEKMIANKDKLGVEKWLERFSIEGDFWLKEKRGKIKNSDWL